jgi:hypothetical protein
MDLEQSQAHTTFLAHADNLCFYMEARSWKREQQQVMLALEQSSNTTAARLIDISASATDAVELNRQALTSADHLSQRLGDTDRQLSAMAQRQETSYSVISNTLSTLEGYSASLLYLNSLFTTQVLVVQSISFYAVLMWASWTATALPGAQRARIWIIGGLVVAIVAEAVIVRRATSMSASAASLSAFGSGGGAGGWARAGASARTAGETAPGMPAWRAGLSILWRFVLLPVLEALWWLLGAAGSVVATIVSQVTGGAADDAVAAVLRPFQTSFDSGRLDVNPSLWNVRFGFALWSIAAIVVAVSTHVDYDARTYHNITQLQSDTRSVLDEVKSLRVAVLQSARAPAPASPLFATHSLLGAAVAGEGASSPSPARRPRAARRRLEDGGDGGGGRRGVLPQFVRAWLPWAAAQAGDIDGPDPGTARHEIVPLAPEGGIGSSEADYDDNDDAEADPDFDPREEIEEEESGALPFISMPLTYSIFPPDGLLENFFRRHQAGDADASDVDDEASAGAAVGAGALSGKRRRRHSSIGGAANVGAGTGLAFSSPSAAAHAQELAEAIAPRDVLARECKREDELTAATRHDLRRKAVPEGESPDTFARGVAWNAFFTRVNNMIFWEQHPPPQPAAAYRPPKVRDGAYEGRALDLADQELAADDLDDEDDEDGSDGDDEELSDEEGTGAGAGAGLGFGSGAASSGRRRSAAALRQSLAAPRGAARGERLDDAAEESDAPDQPSAKKRARAGSPAVRRSSAAFSPAAAR